MLTLIVQSKQTPSGGAHLRVPNRRRYVNVRGMLLLESDFFGQNFTLYTLNFLSPSASPSPSLSPSPSPSLSVSVYLSLSPSPSLPLPLLQSSNGTIYVHAHNVKC